MLKGWLILFLLSFTAISIASCLPAALPPTTAPTPLPSPVPFTATAQPSPAPATTLVPVQASPTLVDSPNKDKNPMSATPPTSPAASELFQVTQAKQDLAKRLSINANEIELVSFQPVTWPDGSLGCPQPGMMYTQMMVEGYRIQLRAAGRMYEYHGGGSSPPFLCEKAK